MQNHYLVPSVWLLVVARTVSPNAFEPVFPYCDHKLLKDIKLFWKGAGTPTNVLQLIAESGEYAKVLTSTNYQGKDTKCIFMNATCPSLLTFTRPCKNPCCQPCNSFYDVEESGGSISDADGTVSRYNIFVGDNVIATYTCNNKYGIKGPPAGTIYVNTQNSNASSTQSTLRSVEGLMDLLGFEFIYDYSADCL